MDFVEQLKSSVDIVRVVGEYLPLKKIGASPSYRGLCPFHNEKTPSFNVHGTHQYFKCFGCGAGGDVIKFVEQIESLPFFEALKLLAERNGIAMPKRADYSDPESKKRTALLDMHEIAAKLFQSNLSGPQGTAAREYLKTRGVSPTEAAEFRIGLSDPSGNQLLRRFEQEKFPLELIETSGLIGKRSDSPGHYDTFRGRLMFPIQDESGKVIAFGGRALRAGDDPKYRNSPETLLYRKSNVVYNLHRAKNAVRKLDHTVLVEGYMDVIGVASAGIPEVVASCGTALTSSQVRALKRHSSHIVVNFDPDTAGANAAERSIQMLLSESMHVRVLELDGALDPDEYVKQFGAEQYRARLQSAMPYFHWLADRARKKFDTRSSDGRMAALAFLTPSIQRIGSKLERAAIASDVAGILGVDPGLVLEQFRRDTAGDRPAAAPRLQPSIPSLEKLLLLALLASPEAQKSALPRLLELNVIPRFATAAIFETLTSLYKEHGVARYAALQERLPDPEKALLSAVAFADELIEESAAPGVAQDCLKRLETLHPEMNISALKTEIKAAERSGNLSEALRLAEELNRLARS